MIMVMFTLGHSVHVPRTG